MFRVSRRSVAATYRPLSTPSTLMAGARGDRCVDRPPGSGGASGSGQAPGRTPLRATSEYQRALALGMRVPVG